ncbi:helix-turn-helix domain-containing protein [Candidatus Omnitrophota bacterium]
MDRKKLGKRIKLARVELDLTQSQFAGRIKTKQKSISHYETGTSLPSIETLVKIAKVLKKPAGHFLDE